MRKKILLMPLLLLLAVCSFAQQKVITGTVSSKSANTPLSGVTVQNKKVTVVTDASGNFTIEAATGDNINFSYVGMMPVTIKVTTSGQKLQIFESDVIPFIKVNNCELRKE